MSRIYLIIIILCCGIIQSFGENSDNNDFFNSDSIFNGNEVVESHGYVGKVLPAEKRTWIDDITGFEITQWTTKGVNSHPYFTVESFIDDLTAIIFSKRTGEKQLYKLNLVSGEMIQMTTAKHLRSIDHLPKFKKIWFIDGASLYCLKTDDYSTKEVFNFEGKQFDVGSFSITCDEKWMVFSAIKKLQTPDDCSYGPFAVYKLSLIDTTLTQITMDYGFNISHVQTNPVDPNLILYCWQWEKPGNEGRLIGHAPIRTWWVTLDGIDGGPFLQEYGTQRTHETWTADGRAIAFVSKYRIGPNNRKHFLGLQSIDGKINERFPSQVSPGHQNIFKDNKHWIVDVFDDNEKLLALLTRGKNKIEKSVLLFNHDSSLDGQDSHPHPRFSPGGKYVLFSTDKSGKPQVYTVRIDLQKE